MTNGRKKLGIHQFGIPIVTLEYTKDASFRMAEAEHERAEHFRAEAEQLRAERDKQTGEDIVREYYKAKRSYPKLTLRKYLQDRNIAHREGYIRKVKTAYDKHKPGRRKGNTRG